MLIKIKAPAREAPLDWTCMMRFDFNDRPFIVIWEVTRACSLACRHCRAEANSRRHPLELNTAESFNLIEQVARCRPVLFVMTGGDPIRRPDLLDLVRHATACGLRVSLSPSATPEFARTDLATLRAAGVERISLSLDGASRATHDRFRGVPGTWDWTMEAIGNAALAGMPVQINTTFTRQNLCEFDDFVALLEDLRPVLWSVFQLVPTGRGRADDLLTAEEMERLFERLARLSLDAPYDIKTTEGQHYRRVVLQQARAGQPVPPGAAASRGVIPRALGGNGHTLQSVTAPPRLAGARENGGPGHPGGADGAFAASAAPGEMPAMASRRAPLGINDGKGFVFISHIGQIQPSGFLPLTAGDARRQELIDVYRHSPLFRQLRDPDLLQGKCGRCEFRTVCGGSRARAYALTGDFLGEEPLCAYQPRQRESGQEKLATRQFVSGPVAAGGGN